MQITRNHKGLGAPCLMAACWLAAGMAAMPLHAQETPVAPALPQATLLPPPAPAEETEDLVEAMRQLKGIRIKSLLFDSNDISYIRYSQRVYLKDTQSIGDLEDFDEAEFLKKFSQSRNEQQQQVTAFTYPQFFLDSIVYRSPGEWAVWISDSQSLMPRQITSDGKNTPTELKVIDVGRDKVLLSWKPLLMDKVIEVWANAKHEGVVVDEAQGLVTFSLHPNQTFTSFLMRVVDGRLQPVTIGASPSTVPAGPTLADPDRPALPSIADEPAGQSQGISGLIKEYERMQSIDRVPGNAGATPPPPTPGNTLPGKAPPVKPSLPKPVALDQLPIDPDTLK